MAEVGPVRLTSCVVLAVYGLRMLVKVYRDVKSIRDVGGRRAR